jgi:hypothetical protein
MSRCTCCAELQRALSCVAGRGGCRRQISAGIAGLFVFVWRWWAAACRGSMPWCRPLSLVRSRVIKMVDAAVRGSLRSAAVAKQMVGMAPAVSCWDTSQRDGTTLGMAKGWATDFCR